MMNVLSHWATWLIATIVTILIIWLGNKAKSAADAEEFRMKMEHFDKMPADSPALGLMPMVMMPRESFLFDYLLPCLAFVFGAGFIGTFLTYLGRVQW